MTDAGPRQISDREVSIQLTGYFMPIRAPNVPVLIGMPDTDDLFIFVFSTEDKLAETMQAIGIQYERVAVVTNGRELLDEVEATNAAGERPYWIRIAVDPYKADNGAVRFVEPLRNAPMSALSAMKHDDGCKVVRENGIAVWMCVGTCPAMYEFIRSGQVDDQPWDQLDASQRETVIDAVSEHALKGLGARDGSEGDR